MEHPKTKILTLSYAYVLSRAIYAAAKINVADHLSHTPTSIITLAEAVKAHPESLYRLMRMLASYGIFSEAPKDHFILTPMGKCLQSKGEDSVRDVILGEEEMRWNAIGHLHLAVLQGKPSFDLLYEKSFFEYLSTDPARSALFDAHMSALTSEEDRLLLQAMQIDSPLVADVGGGRGSFIRELLKKHPSMKGILYDLQAVVGNKDALLLNGVEDRCKVIPGSFFDAIPHADSYLLKRVLHDWDDESCKKILWNFRKVMGEHSKIYVIDAIIPPEERPHISKDIDVFLMALFSGKERTLEQFEDLFASQGLQIEKIHPTETYLSILEISAR